MRNFADNALVMTSGIDKGRLLSSFRNTPIVPAADPAKGNKPRSVSKKAPSHATAPAPPKKAYAIEVIKGNKRTEESFE
jgi:hypothetical protein